MNLTDYNTIKEILGKHGFAFSKSMGQNFLTAAWVPERIVDEAEIDSNTAVLEVGPGIGCLTVKLSENAGKVISVELDEKLMPILAETLSGCENTEVIFGNVLEKNVNEIVENDFKGYRPVVCANLPYNVASPIIAKFLESRAFDTITVMVQKEVAQRICAKSGTSDYSAFSVLCQWYSEPTMLFDVAPDCFVPRPKVTSTVIQMKMRDEEPAEVEDLKLFFRVVKAAFNQRRKTFVNSVSNTMGIPKEELIKMLQKFGISEKIRGEALDINDFAQITKGISEIIRCDL